MNKTKLKAWIPIILLILIGVSIRLANNFSTSLIPGVNGGYYPFQVKSILDNFRLGYSDMPFIFYFQALIVKILTIFIKGDINHIIIVTSKIVDSILPTLIVLPVFILARKQFKDKSIKSDIYIITLCAFSVLYFSFIGILGSDLQKNSTGLVWLSFSLLGLYLYIMDKRKKNLYITVIFVLLNFLTHIGTFGAFVCFGMIYGLISIFTLGKQIAKLKKHILIISGIIIVFLAALLILDVQRFDRLITFVVSPLTFFENPEILFLLNKQPITTGPWLGNYIVCNFLAIFGLIYILKNRQSFQAGVWKYVLSLSLAGLFMSSPLLGIDWSARFLWISIVFLILEYIFIFSIMTKKRNRLILVSFFILVMVVFLQPSLYPKRPHITEESYNELYKIGDSISFTENSIILTRHGLEWWSGLVLNTYVGQDYSLTIQEYYKYDSVYILVQKNGNNYKNLGWSHFLEVEIPASATKKFDGNYFELYKLNEPLNYDRYISKPPLAYGEILEITDNQLLIGNEKYKYKIVLTGKTRVYFKTDSKKLRIGMQIEIWGKRVPFSLKIKAETIHEIEGKSIDKNKLALTRCHTP